MSNECLNIVTLTHYDPDYITEIESAVKAGDGLLQTLYCNIDDIDEAWGTKAEARDVAIWDLARNEIMLGFNTQWSPPIGVYEHLVRLGWTVKAMFCEYCSPFCGTYTNDDGYQEYTWNTISDAKMMVPRDLLEEFEIIEYMEQEEEEIEDED